MAKKQDDLLNEIMARRKANQLTQQTDPLARVFDELNVMDTLGGIARRANLCYGPKVIKSAYPSLGVVIWQRAAGYHGYKTLNLVGVWLFERDEGVTIAIGRKPLTFGAPFYEAEAYHKLIRNAYDLYYKDDNRPPAKPSYSTRYDPEQRLDLRAIIAHEVGKLILPG